MTTPILILGAGNMGGAILQGWALAGAFAGADLILRDPKPGEAALAAASAGARLNPPDGALGEAATVLLAVKPQKLMGVLEEIAPAVAPDSLVMSIVAGAASAKISAALGGRGRIVRVMPNTPMLAGAGASALSAGPGAGSSGLSPGRPVEAMVAEGMRGRKRLSARSSE